MQCVTFTPLCLCCQCLARGYYLARGQAVVMLSQIIQCFNPIVLRSTLEQQTAWQYDFFSYIYFSKRYCICGKDNIILNKYSIRKSGLFVFGLPEYSLIICVRESFYFDEAGSNLLNIIRLHYLIEEVKLFITI